jgi:hypothetical protein
MMTNATSRPGDFTIRLRDLQRLLAQALPHCTATFYPDEGHLSTFVNHAQDIWKAALHRARTER